MIRAAHLLVGAAWGYSIGALMAVTVIVVFRIGNSWETVFRVVLGVGWTLAMFTGYRSGLAAERHMPPGKTHVALREWIFVASLIVLGVFASLALHAVLYVLSHV